MGETPRAAGGNRGWAVVLLAAMTLIASCGWLEGDEVAASTVVPPVVTTGAPTTVPPTTVAATSTSSTSAVSVAMVQVPDVVGLSEADARAALGELGLGMTVTETYFNRSNIGTVRSQWPEPDMEAPTGSEIEVGVAVFPDCVDWEGDTPSPTSDEIQVTVIFICANDSQFPSQWTPLTRNVPAAASEIEATLRSLLDGPNEVEQAAGFGSFFSGHSDALNRVMLDGGRLIVDFNDRIFINNASTSAGSTFFMAELRANLFQFGDVLTIQFQIDGRCGALDEWIQMGPDCRDWTRTEWNRDLAEWEAATD